MKHKQVNAFRIQFKLNNGLESQWDSQIVEAEDIEQAMELLKTYIDECYGAEVAEDNYIFKCKTYEIKKSTVEIPFKERHSIKTGITTETDGGEIMGSYTTYSLAVEVVAQLRSTYWYCPYHKHYVITEFFIEECEYNGNAEYSDNSGIWRYSTGLEPLIEAIKEAF